MPLYLNGTTGVSGVDGTTSSPALQGNDTNTGIVFGTDTISLVEGGVSALSIDSSANASLVGTLAMGSSFLRNRIINGDMRIDQRNAGASGTALGGYPADRWAYTGTLGSKATWQQNAGSVTPPAGFTNYIGITSSSSYSVLSGDTFYVQQYIEGYNVADLAYGTASAKTVTLSFWARSTGLSYPATFGGSIYNPTANKSYLFSYTIPSSGTWTYITVNITGDTASATNTTNSAGLGVWFALGSGSTYTSPTTGSWIAGTYVQPSSTTSVVGTNGATFYITGVQLEVGSVATPFERRQYGQELMLCQRYYQYGAYVMQVYGVSGSGGFSVPIYFSTEMRAAPTLSTVNIGDATGGYVGINSTSVGTSSAYASYNNLSGQNTANRYWYATAEL